MNNNARQILYSDWFMIIMLFVFPPLGLIIMWKRKRLSKPIMIALTVIIGGSYLLILRAVGMLKL